MGILYIINIYNIYGEVVSLNLAIHNSGEKPIYAQIVEQIKEQIFSGELQEGEMIPSMRMLAKELRISVITTKRAYEELEREGFITSMTGKGSFVAPLNRDFLLEENLKKIEEALARAVCLARQSGLQKQKLYEMLEVFYEEELS